MIRLSANENAIGPSQLAADAMAERARSANRYPPYQDTALREALAVFHGQGLTADHFYTGNSGVEVIEFVYRKLLKPGDNVIVCSPTFGIYRRYGELYGIKTRDVPLLKPDFRLDIDQILATIDEQTKMLVLINPNNPTATLIGKAAYAELIKRLPEHVLLLADEVYYAYADQALLPDIVEHILAGKNIVRIHSFSKAFGMAALRLGYGIASPERAAELRSLQRAFHINAIATDGALAVLRDEPYLKAGVENAQAGLIYLYEQLDRLDVHYCPSQANFVMIETPLPSADMADKLDAEGILVRNPNDPYIPHAIRVTVGLPHENEAFIAALERILKTL